MRIAYVLLSPTFGMHQYTADLANRLADGAGSAQVHLITTATLPRDRYSPAVQLHTPVATRTTGFSPEGLGLLGFQRLLSTVDLLQPNLVHITGVHLWNLPLIWSLRRRGIPVIHTLHDLDPHYGVRYASLIRQWNRQIIAHADHLLVHGEVYRQRLLALGLQPGRVTATPLLHLFVSYGTMQSLQSGGYPALHYEPWGLFFGRLERYKGVASLIAAGASLESPHDQPARLVLAGPGPWQRLWPGNLPSQVEVRNRLIGDAEGVELFSRCGLLILPYLDATQSALVAAAYYFRKPVIVARTGALPEYVTPGRTGWLVPPGDVQALADTLAEALADSSRLRWMGEAGRAWYEEQKSREEDTLRLLYGRYT